MVAQAEATRAMATTRTRRSIARREAGRKSRFSSKRRSFAPPLAPQRPYGEGGGTGVRIAAPDARRSSRASANHVMGSVRSGALVQNSRAGAASSAQERLCRAGATQAEPRAVHLRSAARSGAWTQKLRRIFCATDPLRVMGWAALALLACLIVAAAAQTPAPTAAPTSAPTSAPPPTTKPPPPLPKCQVWCGRVGCRLRTLTRL